jgi:hypothetical protein
MIKVLEKLNNKSIPMNIGKIAPTAKYGVVNNVPGSKIKVMAIPLI